MQLNWPERTYEYILYFALLVLLVIALFFGSRAVGVQAKNSSDFQVVMEEERLLVYPQKSLSPMPSSLEVQVKRDNAILDRITVHLLQEPSPTGPYYGRDYFFRGGSRIGLSFNVEIK